VLSAIRVRRNPFKESGLWLKAHLLLISWSAGCVMPLLAFSLQHNHRIRHR